ncbi:MAG TPA: cyclic nucleotide-binding domain-containing protein [Polyangiaceae bacterium]|nr:cyclic nucleotide-binding domain-containing protein [Polyangiaceae bacterium]
MEPRFTPMPPSDAITPAELRDIGLFGGLDDGTLQHLAASLRIMNRGTDELIFSEGAEAREFYVLLRGEIEIFKILKTGTEARIATLSPGHWFGEMSVFDVHRRSASVRTLVPCRFLVVTARDLDALYRRDLKSYTLLVLNVTRELARRLRLVDELVADFIGRVGNQHIGYG